MRVLVTTNDAYGHVLPLVPLVRALAGRGHQVLLASPGPTAALVEADGVEVREFAPGAAPTLVEPPPRSQHAERLAWAVTASWPSVARRWAAELVDTARAWAPDLVVAEPVEHAGRVAAAAVGVPWVECGWGFTLPAGLTDAGAAGLADLYAEWDVAPRPPALRVDLGVGSIQADDIASGVERFRYEPWVPPAPRLPPPAKRRVLVTLGTFAQADAGERIRVAAEAVAGLGAEVVVAIGNTDRDDGRSWPDGVVVAHWLDLVAEVPACDVVVHHAGAGTSWVSLAAGVPVVCLPQAGDQFRNARLIAEAGAALVVLPEDVDVDTVGAAVQRALDDEAMRSAAAAVAYENSRLPGASVMAERLELLQR